MRLTRHIDAERLESYRQSMLAVDLSYPEVGASFSDRPPGYRHDDDSLVLGADGAPTFDRAVIGLQGWQAHRGAGVMVAPSAPPIEVGTTVALALPLIGVTTLAACRIVRIVDEPARFGFAYGTLDGHPERGEEAFVIEREGDTVQLVISAFSRAADPLARLGAPVARLVQRHVTRAYLTALHAFVRQP